MKNLQKQMFCIAFCFVYFLSLCVFIIFFVLLFWLFVFFSSTNGTDLRHCNTSANLFKAGGWNGVEIGVKGNRICSSVTAFLGNFPVYGSTSHPKETVGFNGWLWLDGYYDRYSLEWYGWKNTRSLSRIMIDVNGWMMLILILMMMRTTKRQRWNVLINWC